MTTEPQRTLSFFSPEQFKDYWEAGSEVPVAPYPLFDRRSLWTFGVVRRRR